MLLSISPPLQDLLRTRLTVLLGVNRRWVRGCDHVTGLEGYVEERVVNLLEIRRVGHFDM